MSREPALNPRLEADGLSLDPLVAADADVLFAALSDPTLYRYLDESPPASVEALRQTYARREGRASPDGREIWLNWVVRDARGQALGYVQATLPGVTEAWIGYVFARRAQGRGLATRAIAAMVAHLLRTYPIGRVLASVDAGNLRSIALLERLGFREGSAREGSDAGIEAHERLFVLPGRGD